MGLGVHGGGLRRNDRDVTWILLGGRDYGCFAVLSVNDYEGSEMSFHTLQELNLDAARYRWFRENQAKFDDADIARGFNVFLHQPLTPAEIDAIVDAELARDA